MFQDQAFYFTSASRLCYRVLSILLLFSVCQTVFAQGQDCSDAGIICDGSTIVYDPIGSGSNDFSGGTNSGCISDGEHLSAWYFFELNDQTPPGTVLTFLITPDAGSGQDYDFAVWGPTTNGSPIECGALGDPTRCSFAALGAFGNGSTGLSTSSNQDLEGAGGNGLVRELIVNAGEGYWLMVDNYDNNNSGFSLSWNNSGQYLNCAEPPECGGIFVDPGGVSGNYQNNSVEEYTICPDAPGTSVMLDFTSFNVPCGDVMNIYNGDSAADPILGSALCGTSIPGPFTSTDPSGCLFITFTSNGSTTGSGWTADVTCEGCTPDCTDTTVQPCDDGDPCTENDEEIINCDDSICVACTGSATLDCEITRIRPCDDSDTCTENDVETVDDCNGTICIPCAGTPINCGNGPTSVLPCDDGDACTINDVQRVLNCDGSVCVPCQGTPTDCSNAPTSISPCDDGNPCTTNDTETILDCDGSICIPCTGTELEPCSESETLPCDDQNECTEFDEVIIDACSGEICIPCAGVPVPECSQTELLPCDDGDPCTEFDFIELDACTGEVCIPCIGISLLECDRTFTRPCDDFESCTINDVEGVDECTGEVCIPCAGEVQDCDNGDTVLRLCDDGNPNTVDDVETRLRCDGFICIPCAGVASNCSSGDTTVQPCDDGDACTENDMETVLTADGSSCVPCQ
ncbi:MAG: hypothetical protein ACJAXE_002121, partial [Neolewinella sp.]